MGSTKRPPAASTPPAPAARARLLVGARALRDGHGAKGHGALLSGARGGAALAAHHGRHLAG